MLGAFVFFRWRGRHVGLGQNKSSSLSWQPMLPTNSLTQEGYPAQLENYIMTDLNKAQRTNELMAEGNVRTELPAEQAPEEPSELACNRV